MLKWMAGIVLAGAVASCVAWGEGRRRLPAKAARPKLTDPAPDQRYRIDVIPGSMATIIGIDVDDAGNVYSVNTGVPGVVMFSSKTNRSRLIAGSTYGVLDGPLRRARFGGWCYNRIPLISVSRDGMHVFVMDANGGSRWRHIDRKAGVVRTVAPYYGKGGACLLIVKDKSGELYAFRTTGEDAPANPGYKQLRVARFKIPQSRNRGPTCWLSPPQGVALDVEKMRFYYHFRGDVMCCDLKTGAVTNINPGPKRARSTVGDVKTWRPWCPLGLSISPSGRYLYVGGGDDMTCWRFDLEKNRCAALSFARDGGAVVFRNDKWDKSMSANVRSDVRFAPNGVMYAPGRRLFRLTPITAEEGGR